MDNTYLVLGLATIGAFYFLKLEHDKNKVPIYVAPQPKMPVKQTINVDNPNNYRLHSTSKFHSPPFVSMAKYHPQQSIVSSRW